MADKINTLILYHAHCPDGFAAAWVFHRTNFGSEFVPMSFGDPPPSVAGRNVVVVDFSFSRSVTERLASQAKSFIILDHHRSAARELAGLEYCTFDMEKSGGRLAWEHVCQVQGYRPVPWLVEYTEDRDLWKWELPHSHAISALIASYPRTFTAWEELESQHPMDVAAQGEHILRFKKRLVEDAVSKADQITIDGDRVPVANVSALNLISETGNALAMGMPFAATYAIVRDTVYWSLRSIPGGRDVSEIARKYGGGGHMHAAGFKEPLRESLLIPTLGTFQAYSKEG